jgi:Amiloride-sensitive sodium channel
MLKICENTPDSTDVQGLENKTITEDTIFGTLLELQPKEMETVFLRCALATDIRGGDCEDSLIAVLTDEGICYTFNGLNANDLWKPEAISPQYQFSDHDESSDGWTIDGGYTNFSMFFPYRLLPAFYKIAMSFVMEATSDRIDKTCSKSSGFKVALHSPAEILRMANGFIALPADKQVTVIIKPHVVVVLCHS